MMGVLFWIAVGAVGTVLLLMFADWLDSGPPSDLTDELEAVRRIQETSLAARLQMLDESRRHDVAGHGGR